ncbi:hypothetical protein [Nocardioides gilvus]|uniref:hypothetical protein n=1 Tax=Nocardioides gilvus TaxID=1735589 RepID=UPI000D7452BC|nr:hypothetical protein [Nocardioides gilvus]
MTTSDSLEARADKARQALRQLAHGTRHIEDPTQIYAILGDLSNGLVSFAQSLHQIAAFHDAPGRGHVQLAGDARAGRATSYQVAWELHRAAEMLAQGAKALDKAHELEATITYDLREADLSIETPRTQRGRGLSL